MSDSTTLADCLRSEQSAADNLPKDSFQLAKKGDSSALERLYRLYSGRVYGVCLRIIGDPTEAEAVTKDVFLKVFGKIRTLGRQSQLDAWLHRLAASLAIKKMPTSATKASLSDTEPGNKNCRPLIASSTPNVSLRGSLASSDLEKAFDQLPEKYRQVFLLYDVEGYDHTEIAKMLRFSVQESKSHLFNARVHLRTLLHEALRSRLQGQSQGVGAPQPKGPDSHAIPTRVSTS